MYVYVNGVVESIVSLMVDDGVPVYTIRQCLMLN